MTEYGDGGGMMNGFIGTNSFEKIVVTMYTIRCKITVQMIVFVPCT